MKNITRFDQKLAIETRNNMRLRLSQEEVEKLRLLHKNARLFITDEEKGSLKRSYPFEVINALKKGEPKVYLVSSSGSLRKTSYNYTEEKGRDKLFGVSDENYSGWGCSKQNSIKVNYMASELQSLGDLKFLSKEDCSDSGVPGVLYLPKSGGQVTVSYRWESEYVSKYDLKAGLLDKYESSSYSHGHERIS